MTDVDLHQISSDEKSKLEEELCIPVLEYDSDDDFGTSSLPGADSKGADGFDVLSLVSGLSAPMSVPALDLPAEVTHAVADPNFSLRRIHYSKLTVAEFRHFVASSSPTPLIIEGLGDCIPCSKAGFGLDALRTALPPDCKLSLAATHILTTS